MHTKQANVRMWLIKHEWGHQLKGKQKLQKCMSCSNKKENSFIQSIYYPKSQFDFDPV